jgi:integrase/recombinase XerD
MLRVMGKGRKERSLPLWKQTAADLRAWLAVRGEPSAPELFLNASGRPMTRMGFTYILRKHVSRAARTCPSLREKQVSPHALRHSCAMMIYHATGDLRKVSLWLGHAHLQTTEIYLRADPVEKIEVLETVTPLSLRRGRFSVPDKLIASLRGA